MADTAELEREETIGKGASVPAAVEEPAPAPSLDWMTQVSPGVTAERAKIQEDKIRSQAGLNNLFARRVETDRKRALDAFDATGIQPGELQPWDASAAQEKYKVNPLESFGSLGSVFAMIASAFTKAPMTNALNAGAAAMNAIKDGKDQEYERAYKAFKDNTDLAMKRHSIMQQRYTDAEKFLSSDLTSWRAITAAAATEFDDRQMLTLLNNGYDKEALELQHKRNVVANDQIALGQATTKATFQQRALETFVQQNSEIPDPIARASHNLAAFNRIYGVKQTPQQEIMGQWFYEHPNAKAEDAAKFFHDQVSTAGRLNATDQEVSRRKAELMRPTEEGGMGLSETEADTKARSDLTRARSVASNNPNEDRRKTLTAQVKAEHPDWNDAKVDLAVKTRQKEAESVITSNKILDTKTRLNQFPHSIDKIDSVIKTLDSYMGTAGVPGYARRLEERLGNLAGSNKTEFVQMMRDIRYLQLEAPRLLLNTNGRPLSAEAGAVHDIVAGLNAGDTTANTKRALLEVKKLYQRTMAETKTLLEGGRNAPVAEPGIFENPPVTSTRAPSWRDAPVVK